MSFPILSTVTFLPLIGVVMILIVRGDDAIARQNIRFITLITTLVTFILSLGIWISFDPSNPGFQLSLIHI